MTINPGDAGLGGKNVSYLEMEVDMSHYEIPSQRSAIFV